jgi:transglutaminase-like putative cysteine protease
MDRRSFVKATSALSLSSALPAFAQAPAGRVFNPQAGDWRSFEVTHRVELLKPAGATRVWIPVPVVEDGYQRNIVNKWTSSSGSVNRVADAKYGSAVLAVELDGKDAKPVIEMTTQLQTQSRAIDWSKRGDATLSAADTAKWTAATDLMPTDGIVLKKAQEATRGKTTDIEKVRALYDWTIANTYRNVDTRGCGVGDVKVALETTNFGGKCADINAIFVAMCRSIGIPARDVYGVRVAPSVFGYKELGAGSANITRAQHCRAEVFLTGYGWVPMDPADVTKVQRLETADWVKTTDHPVVGPVHKALFGAWEGNWLAYNVAHDVALPGAKGPKLPFLMYPQAETADGRLDPYDPDNFKYTITTKEIKA